MKLFTKPLATVFLLLLFAACKKEDPTEPMASSANNSKEFYDVLKDETYGFDPLQKFDLYLPKKRSAQVTRVLVLLHGGGWKEGDKGFMADVVNMLKSKQVNWAIVNANYRLTFQQGVGLNEQMSDISLLLNKLKTRRAEYAISDRIFLTGFSSGGHMALLYAYRFDDDNRVKAACGMIAPTDLTAIYYQKTPLGGDIAKAVGKSLDQDIAAYRADSPLYQVQRNSPPTILFYGGKDDVVPQQQGDDLQKKLQELNVPFEYNLYPDQSHSWIVTPDIAKKMMDFGEKHVPKIDF